MKTQAEFEKENNVRIIKKTDSFFMKFLNVFFMLAGNYRFMEDFWTTYRLPFQKEATITFPRDLHMARDLVILTHELGHVKQFAPWYGPIVVGIAATIFPLPIIFSGRWFIERHPYLGDIKAGRLTVIEAVDILWYGYGWCWPKKLMKKWFIDQLDK